MQCQRNNLVLTGASQGKNRLPQDCTEKDLSCTVLARGVKGYHEVSYEGGTDLHTSFIDCDKTNDHSCFYPLQNFTEDQLPEGYRDANILRFVKAQGDLTVRVVSTYTSKDRPEGYCFDMLKGQNSPRYGTGFIQYLYRDDTRNHMPCPCPECKNSPNPRKEWYKIKVRTATHVVFDKEESRHTHVELFYNGDGGREVKKLYGESVAFGAIQGDWCDIRCVSHDLDLCEYIKDVWGTWMWLETKINKRYIDNKEDSEKNRLVVVVSHPHGCYKQVSVGRWSERYVVDRSRHWESCVYSYNTPTCPGSSGAPVWILGNVGGAGFFGRHPHSGRPEVGNENLSGVGLDRRREE